MYSNFLAYLFALVKRPIIAIWAICTGIASIAGVFGIFGEHPKFIYICFAINLACISILVAVIIESYFLQRNTLRPLRIINIYKGRHFNENKIIILLDYAFWVIQGQILVVRDDSDCVSHEVCLLVVQGTTTEGYPQAEIQKNLSGEDIFKYLQDSSRWKSLSVVPYVKVDYLGGPRNA